MFLSLLKTQALKPSKKLSELSCTEDNQDSHPMITPGMLKSMDSWSHNSYYGAHWSSAGVLNLWGMASCQVGNFLHLLPPSSVLCHLSFVTGV